MFTVDVKQQYNNKTGLTVDTIKTRGYFSVSIYFLVKALSRSVAASVDFSIV